MPHREVLRTVPLCRIYGLECGTDGVSTARVSVRRHNVSLLHAVPRWCSAQGKTFQAHYGTVVRYEGVCTGQAAELVRIISSPALKFPSSVYLGP